MFRIGRKEIGEGRPAFIIAEAGVNHNGSIETAKKLVDIAKKSGADAVKFQTFKAEKLVTGYAAMAEYQQKNTGKQDSQFDMLKKLELSFDDFKILKNYCDQAGIIFLSTPFDFESAEFLNSLEIDAYKISSGDLTNIPLLDSISNYKKPVILSSGMATLGEIEEAVNYLHNNDLADLAVLHCVSNYPADIKNVNLKAMLTIKNAFNVVTGYSDHTEGILIPSAAAALGASIIEKHFTIDKKMEGPDHKASLEPHELEQMINNIRMVEASIGNGIKTFCSSEIDTMKAARKSIVASRKISKGQMIQRQDIDFKRPGTGLSPAFYKDVIGKTADVDIDADQPINFNMLKQE